MPIGRPLNIDRIDLDLDFYREMLEENNSTCESLMCADKETPAWAYYQSRWSFLFLCADCYIKVMKLGPSRRQAWDKYMAEVMYEKFLQRSYVHQNNISGFALEESLIVRAQTQKEIDKLKARQEHEERRELRHAIRASATKIGAPDEELLVARQRQKARQDAGLPTIGAPSKRSEKIKLLTSRLIVPTLFSAVNKNDSGPEN